MFERVENLGDVGKMFGCSQVVKNLGDFGNIVGCFTCLSMEILGDFDVMFRCSHNVKIWEISAIFLGV